MDWLLPEKGRKDLSPLNKRCQGGHNMKIETTPIDGMRHYKGLPKKTVEGEQETGTLQADAVHFEKRQRRENSSQHQNLRQQQEEQDEKEDLGAMAQETKQTGIDLVI